jgi:CheY-like chemotaxis protein
VIPSASQPAGTRTREGDTSAKQPAIESTFPHTIRVLVADDSSDNRLLIEAFLKRAGGSVDHAENGAVAVEKFERNRYDIILMDIQMPEMDGYTSVMRIREVEKARGLARTPVIALTASVLDEAVGRTREVGCDAYVTKPVRRERLIAAIRELVQPEPGLLESSVSI